MQPSTVPATPFVSVEAAWFSTARALQAGPSRPGHADAVIRCLDRLYRNRRIELLHARILRIWGSRGVAPNPARPRERSDWRIWREALDRLEGPLRAQGIVTAPALPLRSE
jgi:hypothetical protein